MFERRVHTSEPVRAEGFRAKLGIVTSRFNSYIVPQKANYELACLGIRAARSRYLIAIEQWLVPVQKQYVMKLLESSCMPMNPAANSNLSTPKKFAKFITLLHVILGYLLIIILNSLESHRMAVITL
jgi:hypothetical protein